MSRRHLVPQSALQRQSLVLATKPCNEVLDIARNAEPSSCAVCIVDTSASMAFSPRNSDIPAGRPIDRLNEGLRTLADEINSDEIMAHYSELAIIRCGGTVSLAQEFIPAGMFTPPSFNAGGDTPLAESLLFAADLIENWQARKTRLDCDYCKPFVFIITDGFPTDERDVIQAAKDRIGQLEQDRRVAFFVAATGNPQQIDHLQRLVVRPPRPLAGLNYPAVFRWFAASMSIMSRSIPGESFPVPNPADYGWDTI